MLLAVSILPIALYIVIVWSIDKFSLVGVKLLVGMVFSGLMAALVCYGLFRLTEGFLSGRMADIIHPVVEELVNAVPLLVLALRKKMVFLIDSIICGAAVGGGFSVLENLFYVMYDGNIGLGTALFRGLEVSLIHMGCCAIIAVALMFLVRQAERSRSRLVVKQTYVGFAILLLVAATALHMAHNAFHFNPLVQTISVLSGMTLLMQCTYLYDSYQINRWIDRSMDKQLKLLSSIREGRLDETVTGRYLLSVKDSFSPDVFAGIIRYVQLHTELAVVSKSRFMVCEAGLDYPIGDDLRADILGYYKEYQDLGKTLGNTVRLTLAPLLKFYPADRKALNGLIAECKAAVSSSV